MSSVFLQFDQPGSTVWLYAAGALAVACFLQFTRLFTLRNLDLLLLGLFAPGFLLIEDAARNGNAAERLAGYAWLLTASGVWFVRCLLDGLIVRRPRVAPNLTPPGLFWLSGALLLGLSAVTAVKPVESEKVGRPTAAVSGVEKTAAAVVGQAQADADTPPEVVRAWASRGLALICQAAVVVLLVLICLKHFQDATTAATAAALYLLLPPTAYEFDQSHHVWPTAFVLGAVLAFRRPSTAGLLLGLAAGTSFFPLVLFPAWWQFYHGRGSGRFAVWFAAAVGGGLLVSVLALALAGEYTSGVWQALNLAEWQPWKVPMAESVWTGGKWVYRLPLFIAYLGFVLGTYFWPKARNLGQLLAVSGAALLGIQFWYADRGGLYVLWYAPLLILMILRPTAMHLTPPGVNGIHLFGWLRRKTPTDVAPVPPGLAV
ncbi:MAG: hypothetical protein MUF18_16715 [Fimbriiglobus sp.]|nr:hypothetical protein [Fimbriiglobus sp.]